MICFVITFMLALIINTSRVIGGGVLKGLVMCALFLGRYVLITYLLFFLAIFTISKIREHRKDEIPGSSIVYAMPFVTASVAVTVLVFCVIL